MTQQQHPITPPPELVKKWVDQSTLATDCYQCIATRAARWGADQELEACCQLTRDDDGYDAARNLRADRRPKPATSVVAKRLTSSEIAQLRQQKRTISASAQEVFSLKLNHPLEQLDD